jgi:hypothetical protein
MTHTPYLAFMDYEATGEGRTIMLLLRYAKDEEHVKEEWRKKFFPDDPHGRVADYFFIGLTVTVGVPEDLRVFLPAYVVDTMQRDINEGHSFPGEYSSEFHVNYS